MPGVFSTGRYADPIGPGRSVTPQYHEVDHPRKAAVVAAVRGGTITMEEALRRYQLSDEEFLSWQRAFEAHGLAGLRATRLQQYRSRPQRGPRSRR